MKILIGVLAFLVSTSAFAQQQTPSLVEQALNIKLSVELSAGLQCRIEVLSAQQQLNQAVTRIKELEEKYEPKDKK